MVSYSGVGLLYCETFFSLFRNLFLKELLAKMFVGKVSFYLLRTERK